MPWRSLLTTLFQIHPEKHKRTKKWTIGQKTRWKTAVNWMNNQMNNLSDKWTEDPIYNQMNNQTDKKKLMKLSRCTTIITVSSLFDSGANLVQHAMIKKMVDRHYATTRYLH